MNNKIIKRDYWPTEEWKTTDPASIGMNAKKLFEIESIIKNHYKHVNGILIIKNGYNVFEKYNGYSPTDTHNVASVAKSFTSALTGIAIDKGFIKSVDQKVLDFFPEYITDDIKKKAVSIRHILTMTAPIASKSIGNKWEPLDRLRRQRDWVQYALDLLGQGQPGKFQYSTTSVHLLSAIISRATGMCAREFANKHLFKPIGIKEIPDHEMKSFHLDDVFGKNVTGWIKDPQGITTGGFGLTITPGDMARFGFLYINDGIWANKQVISKKWIDESIASNSNNYGFLWWLRKEKNIFSYAAIGSGGSIICCIPEKDLVISIVCKIIAKPDNPWELTERYIIPAIEN